MNTLARILIGGAGAVLLVAGLILLAVFGGDGTVASGPQRIDSTRTALVWSVEDLDDLRELGDPRLKVSATDAFAGIAPAAAVDRYLDDVGFDEVTDFEVDPFELEKRPHPGSRTPGAPGAQAF
jgi:hypothetical protein